MKPNKHPRPLLALLSIPTILILGTVVTLGLFEIAIERIFKEDR